MSSDLTRTSSRLTRADRESIVGQTGCVVWFTGLSGSGKTTIAQELESLLFRGGRLAYLLDGDNVRHGLNADLGFSDADRKENVRRVGEVAALFADAGIIAITSLISPFRVDRDRARTMVRAGRFFEVFVDTPIELCEERDSKGLYLKARAGVIADFTGISSPYEPPLAPELVIHTAETLSTEGAESIVALLRGAKLIEE